MGYIIAYHNVTDEVVRAKLGWIQGNAGKATHLRSFIKSFKKTISRLSSVPHSVHHPLGILKFSNQRLEMGPRILQLSIFRTQFIPPCLHLYLSFSFPQFLLHKTRHIKQPSTSTSKGLAYYYQHGTHVAHGTYPGKFRLFLFMFIFRFFQFLVGFHLSLP